MPASMSATYRWASSRSIRSENNGPPSRAELERYFFLDDSDLEKVQAKRRSHNRLGFAVQLTSVRYLGRFMPDPRQVPAEVAEYLAEQLGIEDASCL